MVVVLAVLILVVVLALRGYAPEAIVGPVLMLVAGTVTAAGRLSAPSMAPQRNLHHD